MDLQPSEVSKSTYLGREVSTAMMQVPFLSLAADQLDYRSLYHKEIFLFSA